MSTLPGHPLIIPAYHRHPSNTSPAAATLDAAAEKAAIICQAPKAGSVAKVGWQTATCANTPDVTIAIQGVSAANGDPDGANYGGSGPGTQLGVVGTTIYWTALATPAAVARGDLLAVVFGLANFASGDSAQVVINSQAAGRSAALSLPSVDQYTTGAWVKTGSPGIVALEYNDSGVVTIEAPLGCSGPCIKTQVVWAAGGSPDRRGNRFCLPFKCRAVGVFIGSLDLDGTATLFLYNTADQVLASVDLDPDIRGQTAASQFLIEFATPVTLEADTVYYVAILPTSATSISLYSEAMTDDGSNRGIDAHELGQTCYSATVNGAPSANNWTVSTGTRYALGLALDQIGGAAPATPSLSVANDFTGNSITATVTGVDGLSISLRYQKANDTAWTAGATGTGGTPFQQTGLTDNTRYRFVCRAEQNGYLSEVSNAFTIFVTSDTVVAGLLTNIQASLLAHIEAHYELTSVAWPGGDLVIEGLTEWVEPHIIAFLEGPSRMSQRDIEVLVDVNIFVHRGTNAYRAHEIADALWDLLGRASIPVVAYGEDGEPVVGYLRFAEPTIRPLGPAPGGRETDVEQTHWSVRGTLIAEEE